MRPPISVTFPELLDEMATAGSGIAVIDRGISHSYSALAQSARRVAIGLRACGIEPGQRIGLLISNRIEWLEIFFGATMTGAVVVPISTWSTPAELEFILRDADVAALFVMPSLGNTDFFAAMRALVPEASTTEEWTSPRFPALTTLVALCDEKPALGWTDYACFKTAAPDPGGDRGDDRPCATDDALILYTSGSTSKPKAVRLAHRALIENGFNIGERQGLGPDDRVLVSVPLFWAYGSANALPATLSHGGTMVLQERFEARGALDLIEQHRCTAIYTLPTMTAAMTAHPAFTRKRTESLRTGLTIGSPQDVINAANGLGATQICNIYGSSETCGNCCVTPSDWSLDRRSSCQGPPLPGVRIRLIDPDTATEAKAGEAGLIEVTGYLMSGYGGQSAIHNADVFTDDSWYRTGDIGMFSDEGDLVFLGRSTEMIKRAGINVSPAEVEDILLRHPDVVDAAVVGAPDAARGEIIVGFVVCAPNTTTDALIAHCRALSSSYKVPDRIFFRDRLPSTTTGKLQRQTLKADAMALTTSEACHGA